MSNQDDFDGLFAPEVACEGGPAAGPVWKVLLVDDEPDIHAILRLSLLDVVMNGRPLQVLDANSAAEARARLIEHPDIALILLDVVMESEGAGLELVRHVRDDLGRRNVQIILVTGQPGYAPEREVVQAFEINGYRLKSELTTDKIFVSVFAALRAHEALLAKDAALDEAQRFSKAMDKVPCHIYLKDRECRYVYANQPTLEMFGRDISTLDGSSDEDFFPRATVAHLRAIDARVLSGEECQEEVEVLTPDGRRRVYWEVKAPIRRDDGQVWGICGVASDITERKYLEEELMRHREHLESLVAERTAALEETSAKLTSTFFAMDRVGIGVAWNHKESGRFLYANDEACRQLGFSREELLNLTVSDINPEFSPAAIRDLGARMASEGKPFHVETVHRRKDGSLYPAEVTAYLQHQAENAWFIVFFGDITERKRFEAELIQAKDAAEAANRAKSAFLANMSHELRTPMNAIMGMTGIAMRHSSDPRLLGHLEKVEQASQHLLSVINDILDISKIEADKLTLEQSNFRLGVLHENLRSMLGEKADAKGLAFVIEASEDLLNQTFVGDPLHLTQILVNLIGNAIKFTDTGGITVRAAIAEENWSGVLLRYEVVDTGIGIEAEHLPRLFRAFEQADVSLTRRYGGTGLGLAISKRLAVLMGGGIGVESTPGKGSRFWFTVRLSKSLAVVDTRQMPGITKAERELEQHFAGCAVLLAEDEPINQEVSSELLKDVGLDVDLVEDGLAAVACAGKKRYDLILMDLQMPEMNGVDAAREIRRLPGCSVVPILAMTANAFDEDRRACLEAGMNDHVPKPIDPDQLYEVLLKWLRVGSALSGGKEGR